MIRVLGHVLVNFARCGSSWAERRRGLDNVGGRRVRRGKRPGGMTSKLSQVSRRYHNRPLEGHRHENIDATGCADICIRFLFYGQLLGELVLNLIESTTFGFGESRRAFDELGQHLGRIFAKLGQCSAKPGCFRPIVWPLRSAELAPTSAKFARLPNLNSCIAGFGHLWASLADLGPMSARLALESVKIGRVQTNMAELLNRAVSPDPAKVGRA